MRCLYSHQGKACRSSRLRCAFLALSSVRIQRSARLLCCRTVCSYCKETWRLSYSLRLQWSALPRVWTDRSFSKRTDGRYLSCFFIFYFSILLFAFRRPFARFKNFSFPLPFGVREPRFSSETDCWSASRRHFFPSAVLTSCWFLPKWLCLIEICLKSRCSLLSSAWTLDCWLHFPDLWTSIESYTATTVLWLLHPFRLLSLRLPSYEF